VQVVLAPSLRGEALTYLRKYDQVLLANLVRQRGLHHEYEVAGKGTPLVVYIEIKRILEKNLTRSAHR